MAAIIIDTEDLKERIYQMLSYIEDGKYKYIQSGTAAGRLSCAYTAAMDDFFAKLNKDCK